jgi:membrane-associated protein
MFDAESLIKYGGLLLIFLAVYGQTGLFFCFFLPSGGLLFTVCSLLTVAAIMGNSTGYLFGWKAGPLLYKRKDSRFFKQQHLQAAENFFEKYGGIALAAGSFFPLIRTFAPIVSGMIKLPFRRFLLFTIIGSVSWVCSFVMVGYLIASMPFLKPYLKYIVILIILIVTIPVVVRIIKEFKKKGKEE